MKYCLECGSKLELKFLEHEGDIPFCHTCNAYRFPVFNVACSMIIVTKDRKKTLLVQQYKKKKNILVAGYVNKKESAEEAAKREIMEEVGLQVDKLIFNQTSYYDKSNTLMINFIAFVDQIQVCPNDEIDSFQWFTLDEALHNIAENSLAQKFYSLFYEKVKHHEI
ncbi:MAG: NUDIX domain-containing protein [Anaeroplasmataceae bacterium]|nr:NUDIX domain-containing protein [Anaeroplasmataceae bacterium]